MVGPLSSVGNSQLLADRSQIAQTLGWLGLVHLQLGDMANGKARLKQVIDQYQDQIDDVLRAYATLVRAARAANDEKAVAEYIEEILDYAEGLLQRGQDAGYPTLSMRVAQILRLGGEPEAADRARANQRPELFSGSLSARFELSASIDVD